MSNNPQRKPPAIALESMPSPSEVRSRIKLSLRLALRRYCDQHGISREQFLDRFNSALPPGEQVSRATLLHWLESDPRYRLPADVLGHLAAILGDDAVDRLLEPAGFTCVSFDEHAHIELGRAMQAVIDLGLAARRIPILNNRDAA